MTNIVYVGLPDRSDYRDNLAWVKIVAAGVACSMHDYHQVCPISCLFSGFFTYTIASGIAS